MILRFDVPKELNCLLTDKGFIDSPLPEEYYNKSFFDPCFKFTPISLYELLMCVESYFNIEITSQEIEEDGFNTFNQIRQLIEKKLYQC